MKNNGLDQARPLEATSVEAPEVEQGHDSRRFLRRGESKQATFIGPLLETQTDLDTAADLDFPPVESTIDGTREELSIATPTGVSRWATGLGGLGLVCLASLMILAKLVDSGTGIWPSRVDVVAQLGSFAVVVPHISMGRPTHDMWFLVALGDPKIFVCLVGLLALAVLRTRDWTLTAVVLAGPAAVMVLDEFVAKPTLFLLFGGHYGLPSGHVSAVTALTIAATIVALRHGSTRRVAVVGAGAVIAIAASVVGVVVLGMHPVKDAIGGVLFSLGLMALFAAPLFIKGRKKVTR